MIIQFSPVQKVLYLYVLHVQGMHILAKNFRFLRDILKGYWYQNMHQNRHEDYEIHPKTFTQTLCPGNDSISENFMDFANSDDLFIYLTLTVFISFA